MGGLKAWLVPLLSSSHDGLFSLSNSSVASRASLSVFLIDTVVFEVLGVLGGLEASLVPLLSSSHDGLVVLANWSNTSGASLSVFLINTVVFEGLGVLGGLEASLVPLLSSSHDGLFVLANCSSTSRASLGVSLINTVVFEGLGVLGGLVTSLVPLFSCSHNGLFVLTNWSNTSGASLSVSLIDTVVSEGLGVLSGIEANSVPGPSACHGLLSARHSLMAVRAQLQILLTDLVVVEISRRLSRFVARTMPFLTSINNNILSVFVDSLSASRAAFSIFSSDIVGLDLLLGLEFGHRLSAVRVPLLRSDLGGIGRIEGFGAIGALAHLSAKRFGNDGSATTSAELGVRRQLDAALAALSS
jgi:hypothetical protein